VVVLGQHNNFLLALEKHSISGKLNTKRESRFHNHIFFVVIMVFFFPYIIVHNKQILEFGVKHYYQHYVYIFLDQIHVNNPIMEQAHG
jgi:hypothetical protein